MSQPTAPGSTRDVIVRGFRTWALPRVIELPPQHWDEAIRKAQSIDFDRVEQVGLIVGVVFVAYLLRVDFGTVPALDLPLIYLIQFLEALLLLVLLVGPVYLRRARRGLDKELAERVQR
jgi:hypothetical protein